MVTKQVSIEDTLKEYLGVARRSTKSSEDMRIDTLENLLDDKEKTLENLRSLFLDNKFKDAQLELLANEAMAHAIKSAWYERYLKKEGKSDIIKQCQNHLLGTTEQQH